MSGRLLARVASWIGARAPLLLVAWFAFWTCLQSQPVTPYGVQCPTAPVQSISVAMQCCGKTVCATRAPRPGDKGFVQCRCAEKKSAAVKFSGPPKPQLVEAQPFDAPKAGLVAWLSTSEPTSVAFRSQDSAPPVRPPDFV